MCGIAGFVGSTDATSVLLDALHVLEYRGYDSAGIAVNSGGEIVVSKSVGPVQFLDDALTPRPSATAGISHTRWATHGPPNHANAHPHVSETGSVAIVHNGVIGNAAALREQLREHGVALTSDTDSEVIAHLVQRHLDQHHSTITEALEATTALIHGNYAVLAMSRNEPDSLAATAHGSPLLIGIYRDGSARVASDVAALSDDCVMYRPIRNGEVIDLAHLTGGTPDPDGSWTVYESAATRSDRGCYPDYMLKEIHDQVTAADRLIANLYDDTEHARGWHTFITRHAPLRVKFLGCGSALHAGELAAHFVERLAHVPATAESATNFLDREAVIESDCLYVVVSQSGETLDTLLAARTLHERAVPVLCVVNVRGSTLDRESDAVLHLEAGREVSVASTKVVTNMQIAGFAIAAAIRDSRPKAPEKPSTTTLRELRPHLDRLPHHIAATLAVNSAIREAATLVSTFQSIYYLGREGSLPVVREGALKLKEISYLHAEAYHAAELKHGPLALVSVNHATVVVLTDDKPGTSTELAISQTTARGGTVIVLDHRAHRRPHPDAAHVITLPSFHPLLDHILSSVALQVLAYDVAVHLRRNVDRPRNLAKSVTVE